MSGGFSLLALTAVGQISGTIALDIGGELNFSVNSSSCGEKLPANWTTVISGAVCSSMSLWVSANECTGDAPGANDYRLPDVGQAVLAANRNQTNRVQIEVNKLPGLVAADGGTTCGTPGVDVTNFLCAAVSVDPNLAGCGTFKTVVHQSNSVAIHYDERGPATPTITEVAPADSAVALTFSVDSDTASVEVQKKGPGDADFVAVGDNVSGTTAKATVTGLTNGTEYSFRIIAFDAANNSSEPSEVVTGTPRSSKGFWAACRDAGCASAQGCSVGGASLSLAALAALFLVRRARR